MKNSVAEIKNTLEGMNSRLSDIEECTSHLEDRIVEITQSVQQKEKQILRNKSNLEISGITLSIPIFATRNSHSTFSQKKREKGNENVFE